jgi:hypothetical protein
MKSINLFKFTVLLTLISFTVSMQKAETVLEFFNNLFMGGMIQEKNKLSNEFMNNRETNTTTAGAAAGATGAAGGAAGAATNATTNTTAADSNLIQEWLKISSPDFKNKVKFPKVYLPDGSTINIQVDSQYFRINQAYNANTSTNDTALPQHPLNFWFTLSGHNLFYTQQQNDFNVLGAIPFHRCRKGYR